MTFINPSEIPNPRLQIPSKIQIPNFKLQPAYAIRLRRGTRFNPPTPYGYGVAGASHGSLIINSIEFPSALVGMALAQSAVLQFQIPFRAFPGFFVPPISRGQIRTFSLEHFAMNFGAA
jgi:hypothetical protein